MEEIIALFIAYGLAPICLTVIVGMLIVYSYREVKYRKKIDLLFKMIDKKKVEGKLDLDRI